MIINGMKNAFSDIFHGLTVIVGVGNVLRGDDAVGPKLVELLAGKIKAVCIDVGSAPENYIGKVIKQNPDSILIVDAIDLGKPPGSYEILTKNDIVNSGLTTHDLSPKMFIDFLVNQTQADIFLLGIQPQSLSFGSEISEPVNLALNTITSLIREAN